MAGEHPETILIDALPGSGSIGRSVGSRVLADEFSRDGIAVRRIVENGLNAVAADPARQARHLFREGGNIQALAARAAGAQTRVIGLTWIDERQAILVRPDTPVMEPADLKGLRFVLPGFATLRGESIARGMALRGIENVQALSNLTRATLCWSTCKGLADNGKARTACTDSGARSNSLPPGKSMQSTSKARPPPMPRCSSALLSPSIWMPSPAGSAGSTTAPRGRLSSTSTCSISTPALVERFLVQTLRAADWATGNLREL
ncbi:MAG: hypothetical protein V4579_08135 [Pseudomonadota bacterium]